MRIYLLRALRHAAAARPALLLAAAVHPGRHAWLLRQWRAVATMANQDQYSAAAAASSVAASSVAAGGRKSLTKESKLWGGRFEESLTDAVERFSESISFDKALYKQDIMGSKAHAAMLAEQGLITVSDRDSILEGLDEIKRRIESGEFVWRTDREDVHMNIEAALTDIIGEPAKKLHTARSRNDQVVTDLRLWCRDAIDDILMHLKCLQVALVNLALKNKGLIVPGYTHLQRAQPVLLQHLLLSYVEQLERDASRFVDCKDRLNFCPLGACALAGTGLPIDRFMTSDALGFTAPMRNRECHSGPLMILLEDRLPSLSQRTASFQIFLSMS